MTTHPKRVNICLRRGRLGPSLFAEYLRHHVSGNISFSRKTHALALTIPRQAYVPNLAHRLWVSHVEVQIGGLEIKMDDPKRVQVLHCVSNL